MTVDSDQPAEFDLLADLETEPSNAADDGSTPETDADAETTDETDEEPGDEPESEEDGGEEEAEAQKPKKPSGSERLKRRIAALEQQNADLQARRPTVAGDERSIAAAVEAEIGAPPKEEDFKDYLAFERAMTAYDLDKRQVTRDLSRKAAEGAAQTATQQQNRIAELVEDHAERLDDLEKRLPGSMAKIEAAAAKLQCPRHVNDLILESDKSAVLHLHFAQNPDKLADLNRMSPVQAAREIGRLEARVSLPKPRTETKAPPPVRAVKGAAAPGPDPSRMSMAQYEAWRAKGGGR